MLPKEAQEEVYAYYYTFTPLAYRRRLIEFRGFMHCNVRGIKLPHLHSKPRLLFARRDFQEEGMRGGRHD